MARRFDYGDWVCVAVITLLATAFLCVGCRSPQPTQVVNRPVLYVFTSPSCYGCVQDYPVVEKIAGMGLVTVKVIIAEKSLDLVQEWNVRALPTYILFADGREVFRTHQAEIARRKILELHR